MINSRGTDLFKTDKDLFLHILETNISNTYISFLDNNSGFVYFNNAQISSAVVELILYRLIRWFC